MPAPTVRQTAAWPIRKNGATDYAAQADAVGATLPQTIDDMNVVAAWMDETATVVDTRASASAESAAQAAQVLTDARLARDAAQAVASFKGSWVSLSGALSVPATVLHNGQIWSLLANLADVASSEPGVTADWVVQGGLDASKTANFTATRNAAYWISSSLTVTLPAAASMPVGTFVELSKAQAATPVIQTADGTQILVNGAADTSVTYNLNARLLAVFNGTAWEI